MGKKSFLKDFKAFAMKGNVIDLAVGVIIGGAFGKIVSSLVSDIIMPPLGLIIGGVNFTDLVLTLKSAVVTDGVVTSPAVTINYGTFLQNTFDFLVIALAIFTFIRLLNRFTQKKQQEDAAAPPPPPTKEEQLLTEIRDLLKEQNKKPDIKAASQSPAN